MTIFDQGARLVPAVVTEAEEQRILLRIADCTLAQRSQPQGAALRVPVRLQRPRIGSSCPRARLPAVGHGDRRAPPALVRRDTARAVHRQRVPLWAGHRDACRSPVVRTGRGLPLARRRVADALPPPQRAPLCAPRPALR